MVGWVLYMSKLIKLLKQTRKFFLHNNCKKNTIAVFLYTLYYRVCILLLPKSMLEKMLGKKGEESLQDETSENLEKAKYFAILVNYVAPHTPWESKCLVCAMTAQKMLDNQGIRSTLYLGVKKENDKMVAHAWLRCGSLYLTGGNGNSYVNVAKYAKT